MGHALNSIIIILIVRANLEGRFLPYLVSMSTQALIITAKAALSIASFIVTKGLFSHLRTLLLKESIIAMV
jgi:hypothetical protein